MMVIGVIIGIALLVVFTLLQKGSKDSKMGINLSRVHCPKCNEKQEIIRKPNNMKQALYGGYTCTNCGIEMDKFGTELEK
ncbi:hypothetical protein RBU60_04050 [Mesonia sp. MT50]|uniref:TFIIB-type zinc ribbon-containing protein n=1 Tax=Mesonia profundi TaxID=3070998 RepID=A0ABU0ZZA9_9FLAO|nr:hypothetical protein [Mesonia profundi]MDQ7916737.1 hypothetical protein [Mesonia profundi]